jgi:RimJ/RimL family protein N-acetyltransferase
MGDFAHATARLVLRDWSDEDWEDFFRHTNTPGVMRWLGGPLDDEGRAAQRQRVTDCNARHGHCFWAARRKEDGGHLSGELLGFCGIKRADAPNSPIAGAFEIGWRFREDSWGCGYAREAAIAALDLSFARFGAEEVFAITVPGNAASWGLMRRLGMERRADLDHDDPRCEGDVRGQIVHSITRKTWESAA